MFLSKYLNFIVMISASIVKMKQDQVHSQKKAMPPVEQLGPITKWMSDPLPKVPMKPPLQDKYHEYHKKRGFHDENGYGYNLESLRVEDRVSTLAYSPNIDYLRSQNCFALNYQWPSKITLPSLSLSLNSENNVDIQQIRTSAPSGCIVVLVGGKYVHRMDDIVRKVGYITSQLAIKLVNYFAEKSEFMPDMDLDHAIVLIEKQNNNFGIVFHIFCPGNPTTFNNIMFHNGIMNDNFNFKTICPLKEKKKTTRVSYRNGYNFYVYPDTGQLKMEESRGFSINKAVQQVGGATQICHIWEIYKLMMILYNVNPAWIDFNTQNIMEIQEIDREEDIKQVFSNIQVQSQELKGS